MAESLQEDELSLISKGLYEIVSDVVGQEIIVKLRRQQWDVRDLLNDISNGTSIGFDRITSGSRSEGFAFTSSDIDIMYLDKKTYVCASVFDSYIQYSQYAALFCMENDFCSPGFTLLRCLSCDRGFDRVFRCLVLNGRYTYLSSKSVRETFLFSRSRKIHGPCQTGRFWNYEVDHAYALRCPIWPRQATSFVTRSLTSGWPTYDVLKDICSDGCLFVPINSKQQTCSDLEDLEWRVSFSLAERKLVKAMNHCQFLCYGLTKLFLKEAFSGFPPIHDLLCSYFMKTAVFWEISDRSQYWSSNRFFKKFWNVFRRLINWVSDGYCPNFFIPENNMFYGKIYGKNQRMLLSELREMYSYGYRCLLRCSSLNEKLSKLITDHTLSYHEEEYISLSGIEREKVIVVSKFCTYVSFDTLKKFISIIHSTANINTNSELMMSTVELCLNNMLQQFAVFLLETNEYQYRNRTFNKKHYKTKKAAHRILLKSNTYFCMNHLLYAKCNYMAGCYARTLGILHSLQQKLRSQPYMYLWNLDKDIHKIMSKRQQGIPYDTLVKSFIMDEVTIVGENSIDELQLEHHAKREQQGGGILFIPPLVFINFLLILSFTRIGDFVRRYAILEELHLLLYHDDGNHIHTYEKAISWEILGICQQICGDRQAAFQSYIKAFNEKYNKFKKASITRIITLCYEAYVASFGLTFLQIE